MPPETTYDAGTPGAREVVAGVQRAVAITERLNRTPYADADAIRRAFSDLIGAPVDPTFALIPPLFCEYGLNLRVGRDVFVNQGCTFADIGGIDIGDEVLIGPRVSLISSGHPLDPARRRRQITAAPITIERGVWLCATSTVLHGVTVGEDAVVAAGAVVTRDVPAGTLVAGVPARPLRTVRPEDRA